MLQLLVIALIFSPTNSQTVIYKQGKCKVTSIKKTKCGFMGWGNYYVYTLIPTDCDPGSYSSSQCTYDDSDGKKDCEAWADFKVNDKRSCWIKYIDDKCAICDCTDCEDNSAGQCKFEDGCVDEIPTLAPTVQPSKYPTVPPTSRPTPTPTKKPTPSPTAKPSHIPTEKPTHTPTKMPTASPISEPISLKKDYDNDSNEDLKQKQEAFEQDRLDESQSSNKYESVNENQHDSESSNTFDNNNMMLNDYDYVSCVGITVPCEQGEISSDCPLLSITEDELENIELPISDKDYTIETLSLFKIKQSVGGFWKNTHYWFQIHAVNDGYEIRYIAPYADEVIDYFQNHFYSDRIGATSMLPLIEFVSAYNSHNTGKFVWYAGTFVTDENGKINYWSNDSPHFLPSVEYAAAVAIALGVEDAIFVPWITDKYDHTIFYRQYNRYNDKYNAKQSINNFIHGIKRTYVFYAHNDHGHQETYYRNNIGLVNEICIVLIALFFGLLCCMITIIACFKNNKHKNNGNVIEMDLNDIMEESENMVNM